MASLGYANARPRLSADAVPDIPLNILNPGKSVKRVGYEKRKKAEVLNTLLTDNSGDAEHNLKQSATESHEHILEANSAEYATQIWSPPSEKQKGVNIQCQTNFKSLLNFRNRRVQARPDVKSKGTQAVARVSDVGIQCSLVKLPPLHILSSDMTEDPESCLDLEEPGDIDSSNTDQDPDYVPDSEMRDVEDMESDPDEMLPLHNNKLVDERLWDIHQADNITAAQGSMLILGGDGRCDSPGHSAKYCSYTVIDLNNNAILDLQLVQSNEVKSSVHMELEGLKRCLHNLEEFGLTVDTLVSDCHVQVKKFMKEEHKDKNHYFDVWHLAKGVSKKLEMAAKKKTFRDIRPWIKSIVNHIYWVASSSAANGQLKRAKWLSIINRVSDIHEGHSLEFPKCEHGPLDARQWLKKGSRAYKKLKEIVESPYLLRDIEKLSPCHQKYGLEVFHSVVTHYAPKSTHFFFPAMQARLFIAALHYNENCSKQQARTSAGQLRWKVCYPKSKKGQMAVVKPCKEESIYDYIQELKEAVMTRRASLPKYEQAFNETENFRRHPRKPN